MRGKIERILLVVTILIILPFLCASVYADIVEENVAGGLSSGTNGSERGWHFEVSGAKPLSSYTCTWSNVSQYGNFNVRYVNSVDGSNGYVPVSLRLIMSGQTDESGRSEFEAGILCPGGNCAVNYYAFAFESCSLDMSVENNSRFGIGVLFGLVVLSVIVMAIRG